MKNKDSKARMQVIFGVLLFAFVMSAELYAMINYSEEYLVIIGLAAIDLVCLYVVINGLFALREIREARNEEQYDSVFKSEKASYLMLKKYFEEIEDKLNYLEKAAKVPTEEIVNAQKGIGKVIINRNRENTEALINSNDQVIDQFTQCSDTLESLTGLLTAYKEEIVSEQKKTVDANEQSVQVKMQDLIIHMKDMELRLNQTIGQIQKITYAQPEMVLRPDPAAVAGSVGATESSQPVAEPDLTDEWRKEDLPDLAEKLKEEDLPELTEELKGENLPELTEELKGEDLPDLTEELKGENLPDLTEELKGEDLPDLTEELKGEGLPDLTEELKEEELPEPAEEPKAEEKPPMPDLSDPNKTLSPDEIAALFANMSQDSTEETVEEAAEPVVLPELAEEKPIQEAPAEEEKPPMPDLSDPNKTLSPDEIAALFANMQ